ncbi:MAG TPA: hypothetical protein VK489_09065 [Ferruginibacter sp.]|nr:hypothetical protein [Ferruginibacter sp.]
MSQARKHITALGLLLLLAVPVFYSVYTLVKQEVLHQQRNKKFEKETLQTITVSAEDIYWVKPEKEIFFEGKLFDVKSYNKEGDIIFLLGFFDDKEDEVVKKIVQLAGKGNQSKSPFSTAAIKFFFYPVYISQSSFACGDGWKFISHLYYSFDEMVPVAPHYSLIQPPRV